MRSRWRVFVLRRQYPSLLITPGAFVGPGCDISCADDARLQIVGTHIGHGCTIRADHGAHMTLAASIVGPNSVLVARESIAVGAGSQIGEMVTIRDQDHVIDERTAPGDGRFRSSPVVIGEEVWIGAKATVLRGTTIGQRAVVAAHSVIRCDVEAFAVYAGVPGRRVR